jgi:ABC-type ATPase involved in cell division
LLYGSGNWTVKTRDATRITAAEMKYLRRTAGYTWTDHKTNTEFAKELNITLVLDKIQEKEVGYSMLIECHVRDDPA